MSEPGSFAHITLTQRWPAIARRVIAEANYSQEINQNLAALVQDLFDGVIRHLNDQGSDLVTWASYLEPFIGQPWLNVPWYFAETYFYRRLLEATQYFCPGPWQGIDPFASQKQASLETTMDDIRVMSAQINTWTHLAHEENRWDRANLISMLYSDLWGNQADLSLRPTAILSRSDGDRTQLTHILVDDTLACIDQLANLQQARIDLITDNVGAELVYDLYLADFLLTSRTATTLCLHLKSHPTFVSDATIEDVHNTLTTLAADNYQDVQTIAERLKGHIASSQLQLHADPFWTTPLVFWEMPKSLYQALSRASLIFVKGDANYRRLLGDRHWPFTSSFLDIVSYFPRPFVVLRTLKSEVVAGLQPDQVETLNREDPRWLTNSQWGVIQLADLT